MLREQGRNGVIQPQRTPHNDPKAGSALIWSMWQERTYKGTKGDNSHKGGETK